jgi:hypothetical protein
VRVLYRSGDGGRVWFRSPAVRLRRALVAWLLNSFWVTAVGVPGVAGIIRVSTGSWPQLDPWWLLGAVLLAPICVVLFATVPTIFTLAPVALVWRRVWRSVRLSRPAARRAWQERYGHLQTRNAWDLWGVTDPFGLDVERDDAIEREREDARRGRERRVRRRGVGGDGRQGR